MSQPKYTNVTLVESTNGLNDEVLQMGPVKICILEDGTHTDNRLGSMVLTIPPKTSGPPIHWHRMHDETFLITKGTVRFTTIPISSDLSASLGTSADTASVSSKAKLPAPIAIDAKTGDYVIVPPKSIHTFSNPFDEEAEFFNTFTPAYYVDYLRMTSRAVTEAMKGGKRLSVEEQRDIMAQFATFEPSEVLLKEDEFGTELK